MNKFDFLELKKELSTEKGLPFSAEKIIEQMKILSKGIAPLKLIKPCLVGDGIKLIPKDKHKIYINRYLSALNEGKVVKFVPASGAATRMFQKLISASNRFGNFNLDKIIDLAKDGDEECKAVLEFFNNISRFAFFKELKRLAEKKGKNLDDFISNKKIFEIIRLVIDEDGLNYSRLPKGCILFHDYPEGARTAFEEHIVEAMNYSANKDNVLKIHFTISTEHDEEIKKLSKSLIKKYQKSGWKFDIDFSFQSPTTDTISVTLENNLIRDEFGNIVFRPGGHGALLKNLNELKSDIISIKNIDNIVPDYLREETYNYKKILGGYLIILQEKIFDYLKNLDKTQSSESFLTEIIDFIKAEFEIELDFKMEGKSLKDKQEYLFNFLNRPIRVCGMVKREDHPGGSPFWVESINGELTKQIVESAQVDNSDKMQKKIFNAGTHFNPVDIICSVKNYKNSFFDIEKYSNPETGLITKKSKNGKEIKVLELPGLWNGGMYYWLTVFVEVPKITFNPVKEVNDLLKPEHQPNKR